MLITLQSEMFFPAFHAVSCQTGSLCSTGRGNLAPHSHSFLFYPSGPFLFMGHVLDVLLSIHTMSLPIFTPRKEEKYGP